MKKGHKPDFLAIANIGRALCGQLLVANYTGKRHIVYEYFFRQTVSGSGSCARLFYCS